MATRHDTRANLFRASTGASAGPDMPVFVLLHGVGLSHRSFSRLAGQLSPFGSVWAIDLPGFGVGARRSRPATAPSVRENSTTVIEHLGCISSRTASHGPVILVGHSMGTQWALEVALRRPDLVDGLVFVGAVVDPQHRSLRAQGLRLAWDFLFEPPLTVAMAIRDYLHCGTRWYLLEALEMLGYPLHERITGFTGPLLVLRGEHDPIAGRAWSTRLASLIPGARFHEVAGGRHNAIHGAPVETAELIADFARVEMMVR